MIFEQEEVGDEGYVIGSKRVKCEVFLVSAKMSRDPYKNRR